MTNQDKKYLRLKVVMISGHEYEFEVLREDKCYVEQAFKHGDIHEFKSYGFDRNSPGIVVKLEFAESYSWF